MHISELLFKLQGVCKTSNGWIAFCPAHEDTQRSLSITERGGKILLKCFAGCQAGDIVRALGLTLKDLFNDSGGGCVFSPKDHLHTCTPYSQPIENTTKLNVQSKNGDLHTCTSNGQDVENTKKKGVQVGCTLREYADVKHLPVEFLVKLGLSDVKLRSCNAVRIPYLDSEGNEVAIRYRISLNGTDKFRWRKGAKPFLYGLWRLDKTDRVILVEGESDCHTLWFHGFNALGLPGASNWREDRDAEHLEPFEKVYIIQEPDQGGEAVLKWLSRSKIKDRAFIVKLEDAKDPSELHVKDPQGFDEAFGRALGNATPFTQIEAQIKSEKAKQAWRKCQNLACCEDILGRFKQLLPACGLAGEERAAKVLYLALTSRLLERPVSIVVNGTSSAGKSHLVETVLKFFSQNAYHDLTGLSEKALAYSDEPLSHRFLVLYEAAGLSGEFGNYLLRSLLSENCIKYKFTEKTKNGLRVRLIEKLGPTGLIMTTTAVWLHPENETRLLTLTANDTQDQTQNVLLAEAKAAQDPADPPNLDEWRALQEWLECQETKVIVPFAVELARLTKPIAVRLRRDFAALLSLIKAHALLHCATRERDKKGRIVASIEDYRVVIALVGDIIAEGIEATVPTSVRETVEAVRELVEASTEDPAYATVGQVAKKLNLDRSAASRRIQTAVRRGFLRELEPVKKGRVKKYCLGEPLPTEVGGIFPAPEQLLQETCADTTKTPAHLKNQGYQQVTDNLCRCANSENSPAHLKSQEYQEVSSTCAGVQSKCRDKTHISHEAEENLILF